MRKSIFLGCLFACAMSSALIACGGDDGDGPTAGTGAAGGGSGTGGGAAGGGPVMDDPPNADCPIKQGPFDGKYAMKGKCCYRSSNSGRLAAATGGMATLSYRLTYFNPNNHPNTISSPLIINTTIDRFDKEEQHLLFRFKLPYENGEFKAGMGTAQIGPGRYNCNGTYSFYSDTAAPDAVISDKARWATTPVPIKVDPTKESWELQSHTIWASNINREVSYLPYIDTKPPKPLEWEAASQGFDIIKMPALKDSINCVGTRADQDRWQPAGQTVSYQPLDLNNKSAIQVLANISLAQLQAFGSIGGGKDDPKYNVLTAKRCQPGSADCQWKKLPDSLCPSTADERKSWGCHVGDPMNEDKQKTNCTMEKPTGVLDPDVMGPTTSEGQCCDPLATGGALPACNAYRLTSDFVAAAAEITDAPADKLQPNCEGM